MIDFFSENLSAFETIIAALTLLLSLYVFKREPVVSICIPRHTELISPLFYLIEPYLYNNNSISASVQEQICKIIESNAAYADAKLIELKEGFQNKKTYEVFRKKLFKYIDLEYDHSCYKVGIKRRSLQYRMKKKQYPSTGWLLFHMVPMILFWVSVLLFFALVMICLIAVLINYSKKSFEAVFPYYFLFIGIALLVFLKLLTERET